MSKRSNGNGMENGPDLRDGVVEALATIIEANFISPFFCMQFKANPNPKLENLNYSRVSSILGPVR